MSVFPLVKPKLNLGVSTNEETLAFMTLHNETATFKFNLTHLMGSLVHSLVSQLTTTFHTLRVERECARKQKRIVTLLYPDGTPFNDLSPPLQLRNTSHRIT